MKRFGLMFAAMAMLALGGMEAPAQDKYPSKPVKVMVPYGPGSATDIVIRFRHHRH